MSRIHMADTADAIANSLKKAPPMTWVALRDIVDSRTYGDLDTTQLDILTDMVESRMQEKL